MHRLSIPSKLYNSMGIQITQALNGVAGLSVYHDTIRTVRIAIGNTTCARFDCLVPIMTHGRWLLPVVFVMLSWCGGGLYAGPFDNN